jgi:hypothetical protein
MHAALLSDSSVLLMERTTFTHSRRLRAHLLHHLLELQQLLLSLSLGLKVLLVVKHSLSRAADVTDDGHAVHRVAACGHQEWGTVLLRQFLLQMME